MKHLITIPTFAFIGALSLNALAQAPQEPNIATAMVMLDNMRVLSSGREIVLGETFELEKGREVDFYLEDGSTITLKGPVSGTLGDLLEIDSGAERWAKLSIDALSRSGNEGHIMTVRSNGEAVLWRPSAIPVPFDGVFCVATDITPSLYRPGTTSRALEFDISNGKNRASLSLSAGTNTEIPWPESLSQTGDFEFDNPAWFSENRFSLVRVEALEKVALAKAGCTYHLEKMKQLATR